jgi:hypothetical protein
VARRLGRRQSDRRGSTAARCGANRPDRSPHAQDSHLSDRTSTTYTRGRRAEVASERPAADGSSKLTIKETPVPGSIMFRRGQERIAPLEPVLVTAVSGDHDGAPVGLTSTGIVRPQNRDSSLRLEWRVRRIQHAEREGVTHQRAWGACRCGNGFRKTRFSISAPLAVCSTHSIAADASMAITARRVPSGQPGAADTRGVIDQSGVKQIHA